MAISSIFRGEEGKGMAMLSDRASSYIYNRSITDAPTIIETIETALDRVRQDLVRGIRLHGSGT